MTNASRTHPAVEHRIAHPDPGTGATAPGRPPGTRLLGTWLLDGTPTRSPWRVLAAIGALGEAIAHIPVTQEHLTEAPYIGVGFVLLTVAGFALAQLLLTADTPAVWVSTLVVATLALAGYILSRTVGLPQIGDDIGNWTEPLAIVAIAAEALMLVVAAVHLLAPTPAEAGGQVNTRNRYGALIAVCTLLLAGCTASVAAAGRPAARGMAGMTPGTTMPDGSTMGAMTPGMVMPDGSTMAPGSPGTAPSKAAKMICTDETRDNIATVLSVTPDPEPASTWQGGTYSCTYRLPTGTIVLSVHESADVPAAAAYTARLRPSIPGAKNLAGLTPTAFGTTNGVLVLQKDNDTLRVDTSGLPPQAGRLYQHRADFAYEIAAVIMGCWTGG